MPVPDGGLFQLIYRRHVKPTEGSLFHKEPATIFR
jgi:hypothetical protein